MPKSKLALDPEDAEILSGVHRREFIFTNRDFNYIRTLMYDHSGIHLTDAKQEMVYSRLARRLRQLGFKSFRDYCQYLEDPLNDELTHAVNAITTNLTYFFRENHHFERLADDVVPELLRLKPRGRRMRFWSAGCATGEEPYSLAITLKQSTADFSRWDIKILATDLDTNVIRHCRAGIYDKSRLESLPKNLVKRWFREVPDQPGFMAIDPALRDIIRFNPLNLMTDWPFKGPFDAIFCRNVMIYFDKETQERLCRRFYDKLAPGGYLFLGHSEQLGALADRFESLGKTCFRKIG